MFGPKDRFSKLRNPLDSIQSMLPGGFITKKLITAFIRGRGFELDPKRLRRRHENRVAEFRRAGRELAEILRSS
ncbi:MAG: hypothetical protein AAF735_06960 [Myxococcota bacterium]